MASKSYLITHDYKAPYVESTGHPKNPTQVKFKVFRRGDIVRGELKHANNKPAFLLVGGQAIVTLDVIKELVTKEVKSGADSTTTSPSKLIDKTIGLPKNNSNPQVRYLDAMLIGAIVGFGGAYLAEKQGWIGEPNKKNKLIGAGIGAALGVYYIYRSKTQRQKAQLRANNENE